VGEVSEKEKANFENNGTMDRRRIIFLMVIPDRRGSRVLQWIKINNGAEGDGFGELGKKVRAVKGGDENWEIFS